MPKLKISIKKISTRSGLTLGVILALGTIIAFLVNWDIFLSPWFQISKFILVIGFALYATSESRKLNVDKFSFRDAFSAFFITFAIGLLVFFIVNYVLFEWIDPTPGQYLTEMSVGQLDHLKEQMVEAGKATDKIEKQIASLKNSDQFSFANQLQGYIMNLVLYCLPGIIVAMIFKRKKTIIV